MSQPFGGMPTRWDPPSGPSDRVAVILPGAGYSPSHPLLEFGRQALVQHGWTVQQVWWDQPDDDRSDDALSAWVCDQARAALEAETQARSRLVMAKSLGTLAAPTVAELGLDAVWFTPLFQHPTSIDAIARNAAAGARQLLVGGLADPAWDAARARELGGEVVDYAEATHFVHVPDNAVRTVEVHLEIARAVEEFLTRLDVR